MGRTIIKRVGKKVYASLIQVKLPLGTPTGVVKQNTIGTEGYIAPHSSTDCATTYTDVNGAVLQISTI